MQIATQKYVLGLTYEDWVNKLKFIFVVSHVTHQMWSTEQVMSV